MLILVIGLIASAGLAAIIYWGTSKHEQEIINKAKLSGTELGEQESEEIKKVRGTRVVLMIWPVLFALRMLMRIAEELMKG